MVKPDGKIKAKLDKSNPVKQGFDPLIQAALTTNEDYIEVYRHSDLFPKKASSLIYAKKIQQITESGDSKNVGVLCLSFSFDDEMADIFNSLSSDNNYALMLLDDSEKIIASSNQKKHPIGKQTRKLTDSSKPEKNGNHLSYSAKLPVIKDSMVFHGKAMPKLK